MANFEQSKALAVNQILQSGCPWDNHHFFLKGILSDFIQRALPKISRFEFFASICSSPGPDPGFAKRGAECLNWGEIDYRPKTG